MLYFDVTRLLEWQGRYTGMEVVAYELARAIHQNSGRLVYFIPDKGFVDVTEDIIWNDRNVEYPYVRQGSIKSIIKNQPSQLVEELRRRRALGRLEAVVFTKGDTFFTSDGLWDRDDYIEAVLAVSESGAQITHLVHDIVPVVVPHLVHDYMTEAMTSYFRRIAPAIDSLIAISRNTLNDFTDVFGPKMKPGVSAQVFHHGDDVPEVIPVQPAAFKNINDFILCVGTIEIRKNHHLLYQAYKLAKERKIDLPPLVIIGREGWLVDQTLKLMRDDPDLKDKIIFLGPVSDEEMVWCYQRCLFTVMPSFYEGWGLPVAQSLYYGKAAAASSAGPLPEVGGDLNVYFSPFSVDECLSAMENLLDEPARKILEDRIKNEYQATTWQAAISSIVDDLR